MARNEFIGARYVPLFADPVEWNASRTYEPLTIVTHEGNSYTSKQYVPVGADISNADFWVMTGSYNAQVTVLERRVDALEISDAEHDEIINENLDTGMNCSVFYDSNVPYCYLIIAIERTRYDIGFIGGQGTDVQINGFGYDLLKTHDYDLLVNSGFDGLNMINGNINQNVPSDSFGTYNSIVAFKPTGEIASITSGDVTANALLAEGYTTAFELFLPLVLNGATYDISALVEPSKSAAQRRVFGWNDTHWFEGYGFGRNQAIETTDIELLQAFLHDTFSDVPNWLLLDGGGSAQIYDGSTKQNIIKYTDRGLPPFYARQRKMFTFYQAKEG